MGVESTPGAVLTAYVQSLIRRKAAELSRKRGFNESDEDDLKQELTYRLLTKEHLFDPARGATTNTFANRVVESEARMILRDRNRVKRGSHATHRSLSVRITDSDGHEFDLAAMIANSDTARRCGISADDPADRQTDADDIADVIGSLPCDLARVARGLMGGAKPAELARTLGVSRRQIRSSTAQIREVLSAAGFGRS